MIEREFRSFEAMVVSVPFGPGAECVVTWSPIRVSRVTSLRFVEGAYEWVRLLSVKTQNQENLSVDADGVPALMFAHEHEIVLGTLQCLAVLSIKLRNDGSQPVRCAIKLVGQEVT